jgi:hypothetical protein
MLARNATLCREQRWGSVGEVITRDRTEFRPACGARQKCFNGEEFASAPGNACLNSFLLRDPRTPTSSSDLTRTPEHRWRCGSTAAVTYASRHSQVEAANGCGSRSRGKWIRRRARSRGGEEFWAYRLDVANRVRARRRGLRGPVATAMTQLTCGVICQRRGGIGAVNRWSCGWGPRARTAARGGE